MVNQDEAEEYDGKVGFLEYLASFTNPEAVQQIQESRKRSKPLTDEQFSKMLGGAFGRAPTFQEKK